MGTHATINLKLRQQDRKGPSRLVSDSGSRVDVNGRMYLSVYVHNDGSPTGPGSVGAGLMEKAMTYDEALKFILEGDRTTFDTSYYEWRGENVPPTPTNEPSYESFNYYLEELNEGDGEPLMIHCVDFNDNDVDL